MDVNRIAAGAVPPQRMQGAAPPQGGAFGAALGAQAEGAAAPADAAPAGRAGAVAELAAAAYSAAYQAEIADREARRHGRAMLTALARLQSGMLGGGEAPARAELAALALRDPPAHDPVLRLILREIGVRAAVELGLNSD